ncbi:MAG: UDP-3-O-acyl-N-acetylglucosamine deacetylase [Elusimicrobia bacterium]|nr:UDP-3-O-acyl-N-acetylglucosamine deacetylase [Elusimicrobiota bacterium]
MSGAIQQKTIQNPVTIKGVGLHTGRKCKTILHPAAPNTGIKFIRTDLPEKPTFQAVVDQVVDVVRGTTLGVGESRVYTIEHILSALNGLEIDNLTVEMDDNEPPVLDGSALGFIEALQSAKIIDQPAEKRFFTVQSPLDYSSHQTKIRIEPADVFQVVVTIDYNHPMISNQTLSFKRGDDYVKDIAPARTFCFDYEIEALRKNGLAKGGSLDNAIVVGPNNIYNSGVLRFPDEFVRHKILDLMGDLMLLGSPIQAKITATRCGHGHNVKFLKQLIQEKIIPLNA